MNVLKVSDLIAVLIAEIQPAKVLRPNKVVEYPGTKWEDWMKGADPVEASRRSRYWSILQLAATSPMLPASDDAETLEVEPRLFQHLVDETKKAAKAAPKGRPLGLAVEKDPVWGVPVQISLYYFGWPVDAAGAPILKL